MANFYYITAFFADGRREVYQGQLWYLGGVPHPDQAKFEELKKFLAAAKKEGLVIDYNIDYES